MKAAVLLAALVAAGAIWFWQQATKDGPVPNDALAVELAEEAFGGKHCGANMQSWPCVDVREVQLNKSEIDYTPRESGEAYRRCFRVYISIENTAWDYSVGGPATPRTYAEVPDAGDLCGEISHFFGDEEDPKSWRFTPENEEWADVVVEGIRRALCSSPPQFARYPCPSA